MRGSGDGVTQRAMKTGKVEEGIQSSLDHEGKKSALFRRKKRGLALWVAPLRSHSPPRVELSRSYLFHQISREL